MVTNKDKIMIRLSLFLDEENQIMQRGPCEAGIEIHRES